MKDNSTSGRLAEGTTGWMSDRAYSGKGVKIDSLGGDPEI